MYSREIVENILRELDHDQKIEKVANEVNSKNKNLDQLYHTLDQLLEIIEHIGKVYTYKIQKTIDEKHREAEFLKEIERAKTFHDKRRIKKLKEITKELLKNLKQLHQEALTLKTLINTEKNVLYRNQKSYKELIQSSDWLIQCFSHFIENKLKSYEKHSIIETLKKTLKAHLKSVIEQVPPTDTAYGYAQYEIAKYNLREFNKSQNKGKQNDLNLLYRACQHFIISAGRGYAPSTILLEAPELQNIKQDRLLLDAAKSLAYEFSARLQKIDANSNVSCEERLFHKNILSQITRQEETHVNKMIISPQQNGDYFIHLNKAKLIDYSNQHVLFVNKDDTEIGRINLSSNKICFKGNGNSIHLKIDSVVTVPILIVDNPGANISLSTDISCKDVLYVTSDASHFSYHGVITSEKDINLDVTGQLDIYHGDILGHKKIKLRADSVLLEGKIDATDQLLMDIQSTFEMSSESELKGKTVSISANSLKNIKGNINSDDKLVIHTKDSINFNHTAKLIAGSITLATRAMICTGSASFKAKQTQAPMNSEQLSETIAIHDIVIHIKEKLIIDQNSQWTADNIRIRANQIDNRSKILAEENLFIHSDDELINHPEGILNGKTIQLTGDSIWNTGQILYTRALRVSLNKLFVNGLSSASEWNLLTNKSCIKGGDISIIAGAFINVAGSLSVENLSSFSLAEISLGGLVQHLQVKKSSLIALDLSLNLPNLPLIKGEITNIINKIKAGDFKSLASILFSWNSFLNASSCVRWTLNSLAPAVGKPVNIAWGILMFLSNLSAFYQQCQNLYQQDRKIEARDIYPLLTLTSSIANQGAILYSQIDSLRDGLDEIKLQLPQDVQDVAALTLDFATTFGPSTYNESFIQFDLGKIDINTSVQNRSALDLGTGSDIALNVSNSILYGDRHGLSIANNVTTEGKVIEQGGIIITNNLSGQINQLHQTGTIIAPHAYLQTKDTNISPTASLKIKDGYLEAKNHLDDHGNIDVQEFLLMKSKNVELQPDHHLTGKGIARLEGEQISPQGTIENNKLIIASDHIPDRYDFISGTGIYQHVNPQALEIITTDPIVIDNYIPRDGELAVTGAEVKVTVDCHFKNNFIATATQGNVEVESTVTGDNNIKLLSEKKNVINKKEVVAKNTVIVEAKQNINNEEGGRISGAVAGFHTQKGNIENKGTLEGTEYLQGIADQGNILNQCSEHEVRGQYDTMKAYHPAEILGGTGKNHEGTGTYLRAGKKVIHEGSKISSAGSNIIEGELGIESTARHYSYISHYKHSSKWYGKKKTEYTVSTQVQHSVIHSDNGSNNFISKNGRVYSCSTKLSAPQGNNFYVPSENDVKFDGLVVKTEHYKDKSYLWGLINKKRHEYHEVAVPTVAQQLNDGHIYCPKGNVEFANVLVLGRGFEIEAPFEHIIFSAPLLLNFRRFFSFFCQL